jgi:hypothetical protein
MNRCRCFYFRHYNEVAHASRVLAAPRVKAQVIWLAGRAVAQAVSRWLPTAAARVRGRAACGVCGG